MNPVSWLETQSFPVATGAQVLGEAFRCQGVVGCPLGDADKLDELAGGVAPSQVPLAVSEHLGKVLQPDGLSLIGRPIELAPVEIRHGHEQPVAPPPRRSRRVLAVVVFRVSEHNPVIGFIVGAWQHDEHGTGHARQDV